MRFLPSKLSTSSGFSLVEALVAVVLIGIFAAIAIPSWQNLLIQQRVSRAQAQAYQAFRRAKFNAKREKRDWLVSFRENNSRVEYAVHRSSADPLWQALTADAEFLEIDTDNTTLSTSKSTCNNFYCVKFTHKGTIGGRLGRITLGHKNKSQPKQCIFISSLLGTLRRDEAEGCIEP
ncbi:prepilin-type N-terminal cleavage/methylation domain-containing protein [Geitlerinema sp. PCC 9228]|jgi:prepilin-type N-terminal cleavage/methylation domain-containing protein|uniref:pilus assembly FimT family protein n=1 Tax=Geitlerinema sp. PCC 9228 TaxID=111611 RepID=UPI0008F9C7CA|nr:prepilin-type N-terminal cleavage/methylation domain-containing protein [Geitlerinema sp. PCC 9228]